ncbi:MAG: ACT domain-containing protein [Anaerolineae bacterium]
MAEAGIPLFVLSTYDTDYILVREQDIAPAAAALTAWGHHIEDDDPPPSQAEGRAT